ncbi:MAG: hypothetical protein MRY64_13245 [Hyphomonadaceae bacterium]|nr:hypothetical protein [Hyphomonadaceae bacterium]
MIRLLTATSAICLAAGSAAAQSLAGGPAPNMVRHGTDGACQSVVTTQSESGVRMHRGTSSGCDAVPAQAAPQPASQSTTIVVDVDTTVELRDRRLGTSPYVLGAPRGGKDVYYGTNPYVLGAPGGF